MVNNKYTRPASLKGGNGGNLINGDETSIELHWEILKE